MENSIVETAKKRFNQAKDFYDQSRRLSEQDKEFVFGDCYNFAQWPDYVRNDPALMQKVKLTINIVAQHCNQVINNIRMNRPHCKVIPLSGGSTKESAQVFEGYIRSLQSISNADDAHDQAAEYAVYGGEGYWRVMTEYVNDSFEQQIRIKPIPPDCTVYIDPNAKELDNSDAEWAFVLDKVTKEVAQRDYGDDVTSWHNDGEWVTDDAVIIAEYFHCEYKNDVLERYEDGSTGLKSENNGLPVVESRKIKRKVWHWCKLVGNKDKPEEQEEWLGETCPVISSLGKRFTMDGVTYLKGMVRDLIDQNRMVNFSASTLIETTALQPKAPFTAPSETIDKYQDFYKVAHKADLPYLPYESYNSEGQPLNKPERAPPPMVSQGLASLIPLFTEQMRAASGQSSANFGIKSEASSGIGIQRLKAQGEVATFHYPDNHARALRYEMRVLVDLVPHYLNEGEIIRTLGLDGKEQSYAVSKMIPVAFQKKNAKEEGIDGIWNPWIGKYDYQVITGASYQTQRQDFVDLAMEMAKSDPRFMQAAGHLVFAAMDIPFSDELARIYEKMQPPELKDEENPDNALPMLQQQAQQMQMEMEQMQQALQQASQEVQQLEQDNLQLNADKIKTELKAEQYKAELNMTKLQQQTMPMAGSVPREPPEVEEDDAERDPQLDALLWKLEESSEQNKELLSQIALGQQAVLAEVAKPKQAAIRIQKNPDGSFSGERMEQ